MILSQSFKMLLLVVWVALLAGCTAAPVKQLEVYTPGLVITAEDGSFVLKSGEAAKTPFYSEMLSVESNALVDELPGLISGKKAKLVRVSMPGLKEPLYGAIMFPAFHKGAKGPATRVLGIEVPQRYVDAAMNARISAVFERVALDDGKFDYAWILWLSDHPLAPPAPVVVPKAVPPAAAKDTTAPKDPVVAPKDPAAVVK